MSRDIPKGLIRSYNKWNDGVDPHTISKLLGHASIQTTQMYAHLVQKSLNKAMAVLNNDAYK